MLFSDTATPGNYIPGKALQIPLAGNRPVFVYVKKTRLVMKPDVLPWNCLWKPF